MSQPEDVDNPGDQPIRRGQPAWRRLAAPLRARLTFAGVARQLRTVGPVLAIAVILAGFGIAFASQSLRAPLTKTANGDATATASLAPSDTATLGVPATATASSAPATATPGDTGPANTPTAPLDMASQGFHIKSATVTASADDNFSHTCAATVNETFTLTLVADLNSTGETVSYSWLDLGFDHSDSGTKTVTFAPGEMSKTVTLQEPFSASLGDGTSQQDSISVYYPDAWIRPPGPVTHATVAFTCVRHLTGLTLTPSISAWNAPCATSTPITFTWTVTASPGPQLFVVFGAPTQSNPGFAYWLAPQGFGAYIPATRGFDEESSSDSGHINDALTNDSLLTSPDGDRWIQVATTSPEVLTARATVTKNCGTATPLQ